MGARSTFLLPCDVFGAADENISSNCNEPCPSLWGWGGDQDKYQDEMEISTITQNLAIWKCEPAATQAPSPDNDRCVKKKHFAANRYYNQVLVLSREIQITLKL